MENKSTFTSLIVFKTFDISDMSLDDFDNLDLERFNVKNYSFNKHKFNNYYVFRFVDPTSSTNYSAMFVKKDFAEKIKELAEKWKKK